MINIGIVALNYSVVSGLWNYLDLRRRNPYSEKIEKDHIELEFGEAVQDEWRHIPATDHIGDKNGHYQRRIILKMKKGELKKEPAFLELGQLINIVSDPSIYALLSLED